MELVEAWIVAGVVGLAMIVLLGSGLEASRGRALKHEIRAHGLSERANRLLRDPLASTAKTMTWTLMLAIMFLMTTNPPAWGCAASLGIALLAGAIAGVPICDGHQGALPRPTPRSKSSVQAPADNATVPVGWLFCIDRGTTRGRPCAPAGIRAQLHGLMI